MIEKRLKFWRAEMKMLDTLYAKRMETWQRQLDALDMKFSKKMRDLDPDEILRVPLYYPAIRQTIGTIAFNYPKLFFNIEDEQGEEVKEILERAAASLLRLMEVKPHVHQAIFDALTCSVGWLRIDVNPPGDDMIWPFVANDAMHEDLTAVNRVAPGFVHVDPMCPPHTLGHARYIRERMWVPVKYLRDDPNIVEKSKIRASTSDTRAEFGFGELEAEQQQGPDFHALKEAVQNDDYVLCDRIHDRMEKKLIVFCDGVHRPVMEIDHPYQRMVFPERFNALGETITDEGGQPLVDLDAGEAIPGWLCENGFGFVPIKFDMHATSFYPLSHLEYLEDLQNGIVESVSRQANMMKRTSRQVLVNQQEALDDTRVQERVRTGRDGELITVQDVNNYKPMDWGSIPGEQYALEDRLRSYWDQISQVNELTQGGSNPRTATEAALQSSAASVNREWMESKVADVYEMVVRNCFQIMGDARYTPDNFAINVAPDGAQRLVRALQGADFLWNYRIEVKTGSMQPLVEQLEAEKVMQIYPMLKASPNFDQKEVDKWLLAAAKVEDIERLMVDDTNRAEQRAAQLENELLLQGREIDVLPEQDAQAHIPIHQQYVELPHYQSLMAREQAGDQVAAAQRQQVDKRVQEHMQMHAQMEQQKQQQMSQPPSQGGGVSTIADTMIGQVQANAQRVSDRATRDAEMALEGA